MKALYQFFISMPWQGNPDIKIDRYLTEIVSSESFEDFFLLILS
jgi:hypothetical protein